MFRFARRRVAVSRILRYSSLLAFLAIGLPTSTTSGAERKILVAGLKSPESVAVTSDGRIFVSMLGKMTVKGDGEIVEVKDGKALPVATGMDDPAGLTVRDGELYCADKTRVWQIDRAGKASVYLEGDAFPIKAKSLNDITTGPNGDLFVSDSGNFTSNGVVFRISPQKKVTVVISHPTVAELKGPNGILCEGSDHLLLNDFFARRLLRVSITDGKVSEVAKDLGGADGLARDKRGRLFVSDWGKGRVFVIDDANSQPRVLLEGFKAPADLMVDPNQDRLLIPDMRAGTLSEVSLGE